MSYNEEILNRFLTEKVVINVETQQEWIDFMKLLEKETKVKWEEGDNPTEYENWSSHTELSAIVSKFYNKEGLTYSSIDFYEDCDYEVIKYKDLIKGEETMTNIEKVNKALENADEETKKEVFKLLGIKETGKFIPKPREKYYYIGNNGLAYETTWYKTDNDHHKLLMSNVYRTEEEAEQALDFQTRKANLLKEIEDSSDVIDWGDGRQSKYRILLDRCNNSLVVRDNVFEQTHGTAYTTNRAFLYELTETRSDEVKELLFGIK